MTTTTTAGELCAAYGCPMIAAIGVAGHWYCACHWRSPVASFDAITAELHRQQPLVEAANYARRSFAGYVAIRDTETALTAITHALGQQYALHPVPARTGSVLGPTSEAPHYARGETEVES